MTHRPTTRRLAALLLVATAVVALAGLAATAALADDGGMAGMPGMTEEEMQAMGQPTAARRRQPATRRWATGPRWAPRRRATLRGDPRHASGHGHGRRSVNWIVIGGFLAIVAGSTLARCRHEAPPAPRMAAGELAGAGVQHV